MYDVKVHTQQGAVTVRDLVQTFPVCPLKAPDTETMTPKGRGKTLSAFQHPHHTAVLLAKSLKGNG